MSLCGYCNSKKLFVNLDRHKCKAAENVAKLKIQNEIVPIIRRLTVIVIKKMKIDEDIPISPILMFKDKSKWMGNELLHFDNFIDQTINDNMWILEYLRVRFVLEESVENILKYCLKYKGNDQYGNEESQSHWFRTCSQIIYTLADCGVELYKSEPMSTSLNRFCMDYDRVYTIIDRFVQHYNAEEQQQIPPKQFAPTEKTNVVLYMRVSTNSQSANSQNKILLNYCIQNNLRISATYEDVGSARVQEGHVSPTSLLAFSNMIEDVKENTCILVSYADRFGRNVKYIQNIVETLHKKNCYIFVVCNEISSHDDIFMKKIQDAENTSNDMSDRMKMIKNL